MLVKQKNSEVFSFTTYILSTPFKKGNQVSNCSRCVSPWTIKTGIRNNTVMRTHATMTTKLLIHLFRNDAEKKGQYTSSGSGAGSLTHCVGFTPCCMCIAAAAAKRVLKDTKAAPTSCYIGYALIEDKLIPKKIIEGNQTFVKP